MAIKERISEFISTIKTNNFAFEKKCGLSRGYLNAIKEDVGSSKLELILRAYPELSAEWLLLGEGPMLKKNDTPTFQSQNFENINQISSNIVTIPAEISSALIKQLEVKDSQIAGLQGQNSSLTTMLQYTLTNSGPKLQEPRT